MMRREREALCFCLQINYAEMLSRIEPLRNELASLETAAQENRKKNEDMQKLIAELEHSIAKYKEEYALLISQAQAIKADLQAVEAKVRTRLTTDSAFVVR